ncbi:MAG: rhomboid family intramembrane serine protease [archaeon]
MAVYKIYLPKKKSIFNGFGVTINLIVINVILYFVSLVLFGIYGKDFFLNNLALTPSLIIVGKSLWTLFTSMFMHGSFFHLFANMFSLFFIGTFLERIIGRKRFLWTYLISGLVGGLFYIVATMILGGTNVPAVGASGAIFGLLGVLAVLVPKSKIYLIVGPLILIVIEILVVPLLPVSLASVISVMVNILIFVMIFSLLSFKASFRKIAVPVQLPMWLLPIVAIVPLAVIGLFVDLPIGNSAHLGGLIIGLIYGFYLRNKFPRKTAKLEKIFSRK